MPPNIGAVNGSVDASCSVIQKRRALVSEQDCELAEVNPAAARKLIERLERQKDLLSSFPQMTEKGLLEGTRKVSMPPLVLTIRARDGVVEIAAIRDAWQKDAYAPAELGAADDIEET